MPVIPKKISWAWIDDAEVPNREGCVSCARYALVVLNIFFLTLGILLVCLAVWFRSLPANWNVLAVSTSTKTREDVHTTTMFAIAAGSTTIAVAFVGFCGAISNSKYVLGMFFLFMAVHFVLLLSVGGLGIWLRAKIVADSTYQLQMSFIRAYSGDQAENVESVAWKHMQSDLKCCGVTAKDGFKDFRNLDVGLKENGQNLKGAAFWRQNNFTNVQWPDSCCTRNENRFYVDLNKCRQNESASRARYETGCEVAIEVLLNNDVLLLTVLAILQVIIEAVHFCTLRQLEAATVDDDTSTITLFSFERTSITSV
ncbi:unnamed protein product [Clavelina lepadiformis]|uniref:Tetraspanin n=1 Tax=Clavelina lepadiformis TaxID=159417 RepID=A0ABP0GMX3_CLALP